MSQADPAGPTLRPFAREHLAGALALFAAEDWQTYTADPERTYGALAAPGSTTVVAIDGATVVGLVQLQSDGWIQAHLSALVVASDWRRRGLARALLREALGRAGGLRIDVLTRSERFYRGLGARPVPGFPAHAGRRGSGIARGPGRHVGLTAARRAGRRPRWPAAPR